MSQEPGSPPSMSDEIPPDDMRRNLTVVSSVDGSSPHISLAGDTYTILLTGAQTGGRFCMIDMHIPPGGGPPPHRHDYEETFSILEGELEVTFRGTKVVARAGQTVNIPANAPHNFRNQSSEPVRLLCIGSPAGMEELFMELGVPVATRTAPPPPRSEEDEIAARAKAMALAARYRTEFLVKD